MSQKRVILNTNIFIIIYILIFIPSNLYAYIDPGSATIFLQALIAGLVGFILAFKTYVVSFFKKLFRIGKKKSAGK